MLGQPPAAKTAFLYLDDGPRTYRVQLEHTRVLIGSAPDNDVTIADAGVAAHHAILMHDAVDDTWLISAASEGPIAVNGQRLSGTRRLFNGDVLNIGGSMLTFAVVPEVSPSVLQLGVVAAGERPWFVLFDRPVVRIGHSVGELLLPDELIASPHAVIESYCPGALFLVNLDAYRGTFVNGIKVHQRTRLSDGDVVRLGVTELHLRVHATTHLPAASERLLGGSQQTAPIAVVAREEPSSGPRVHNPRRGDLPYYLPEESRPAPERPARPPAAAESDRSGLTQVMPEIAPRGGGRKHRAYYLPGAGELRTESADDGITRQDLSQVPKKDPRRRP